MHLIGMTGSSALASHRRLVGSSALYATITAFDSQISVPSSTRVLKDNPDHKVRNFRYYDFDGIVSSPVAAEICGLVDSIGSWPRGSNRIRFFDLKGLPCSSPAGLPISWRSQKKLSVHSMPGGDKDAIFYSRQKYALTGIIYGKLIELFA